MIPMSREIRIFGMILIFVLPAAALAESSSHAGAILFVAALLGAVAGEAWHRWRCRSVLTFREFRVIREEGFRDAIESAAKLLEDCAPISENPAQAQRHATLIRQLKPPPRADEAADSP